MSQAIRTLVAEDRLIARVGIVSILNTQSDMTVVAEALNGRQATGKEFPGSRIIALTTFEGDENVRRAVMPVYGRTSRMVWREAHKRRLAVRGGTPVGRVASPARSPARQS